MALRENLILRKPRSGCLLAALLLALPTGTRAAMIREPQALLLGLDKITARVSKFVAPVGTPVRFGTLTILVRDCEKNPPEERPESAAFLQIDENRPGQAQKRLFSGWMFSSSPALSALEDPVYDVNVLDCRAASAASPAAAPPPKGSAGNTAVLPSASPSKRR
jgi:hypothetical protein